MNLLKPNEFVKLTALTRKITLNGITKIYPVYKIRIDALYYNDQNDRIASWISQFKEENNLKSLSELEREEYNQVIERFIIESNPASIDKTQVNIELVGQREPGVVMSDGRVIDGNRRYTCIRRLSKKNPNNCWFEAVILDMDLQDSKKSIKMLELSIQHGEEKRVDYNHVEKLIGIYQDIVETELLTIQEYAMSTNESVNEVKAKVEASKLLVGFLEYIGMAKQYHIARDFQIVSLINDVMELFKKCISKEQVEQLIRIVYLNILMNTIGDSRKYVKNISSLLLNNTFNDYAAEQRNIEAKTLSRLHKVAPKNFYELRNFVRNSSDISQELYYSLDDAVKGAKTKELFSKPTQIVSKTITALRDIDTNIVNKMSSLEKEKFKNQIKYLNSIIDKIDVHTELKENEPMSEAQKPLDEIMTTTKVVSHVQTINDEQKTFEIVPSKYNDFVDIEVKNNNKIVSLCHTIKARLPYENKDAEYSFFFINKNNKECSNIVNVTLTNEYQAMKFNIKSSGEKAIFLAIKKASDGVNQIRFLIEYELIVAFGEDVDF